MGLVWLSSINGEREDEDEGFDLWPVEESGTVAIDVEDSKNESGVNFTLLSPGIGDACRSRNFWEEDKWEDI